MPEARPMQTYSTLLEDRRIIDAAAEAGEAPSLVVHLMEKEWSIRPGRAPANATRGRFTYSQPVSGILDDIQARRIPPEFSEILKKANVKLFEGCLIVEIHDSRPVKGGPTKTIETRVDKYVLRPTSEAMWADIRDIVDSQRGWGDKEALELEARITLATAPPLCLDPSPSINRTANVIIRSGATPSKISFKRKQVEDTDDDAEIIKRRKLMQLMNPRLGKPFNPSFLPLRARQNAQQNGSTNPAIPGNTAAGVARPANGPAALLTKPPAAPAVQAAQATQVAQAAQNQNPGILLPKNKALPVSEEQKRSALRAKQNLPQPPAATTGQAQPPSQPPPQQTQPIQTLVQQPPQVQPQPPSQPQQPQQSVQPPGQQQVPPQVAKPTLPGTMANVPAPVPPNTDHNNPAATTTPTDAMAQMGGGLQKTFNLVLPDNRRNSKSTPTAISSPPKPSVQTPAVQAATSLNNGNVPPINRNPTPVQQTPRQLHAVPQMQAQVPPAQMQVPPQQNPMAAYHQPMQVMPTMVNGQPNPMYQAYPNQRLPPQYQAAFANYQMVAQPHMVGAGAVNQPGMMAGYPLPQQARMNMANSLLQQQQQQQLMAQMQGRAGGSAQQGINALQAKAEMLLQQMGPDKVKQLVASAHDKFTTLMPNWPQLPDVQKARLAMIMLMRQNEAQRMSANANANANANMNMMPGQTH